MTDDEVARLATAFAEANGHSHAGEYSAKVVAAWKKAAPAETNSTYQRYSGYDALNNVTSPPRSDTQAAIDEARAEQAAARDAAYRAHEREGQ
jgi:hypothetical protein